MDKRLKSLQLFYAGALADAASHYGKNGIMEKVTAEKKELQKHTAAAQLKQLGISDLETVYGELQEIFGCADWKIREENPEAGTLCAETSNCMLCAIAKKLGAPKPCYPFCINPFAAYAEVFGYELNVESTLWDGNSCVFNNIKKD